VGYSLGNSLLDLNFELIVGPNILRDLSGGPIPTDDPAEIPGGITLAFNGSPIVGAFTVMGLPGERIMWAVGGRVSISENPNLLSDIIEQIEGDIDIGQIIAVVLPLFANFYSGIDPNVVLEIDEDGSSTVIERDIAVEIPLGRRLFIEAPMLPETEGQPLETGLFLAGAMVPGHGFVPFGITAAVDDAEDSPEDRRLDGDPQTPEIDPVILSSAPIHSGIRSPQTRYALVSVALSLSDVSGSDVQARENTSGLITRMEPGVPFPEVIEFDDDSFPGLAEGSTYDAETRTVTIVPNEDFEPDFYRVLFKADQGRTWQVHLPIGVMSYELPDLTEEIDDWEDRTLEEKVSLIAVRLEEGLGATYAGLISTTAPNLDALIDFVDAFAVVEIGD
jgi:hypothetical protein